MSTNLSEVSTAMDTLWDSLGQGVRLEPDDYEALRQRYNALAEAAERAVLVYRLLDDPKRVLGAARSEAADTRLRATLDAITAAYSDKSGSSPNAAKVGD